MQYKCNYHIVYGIFLLPEHGYILYYSVTEQINSSYLHFVYVEDHTANGDRVIEKKLPGMQTYGNTYNKAYFKYEIHYCCCRTS